MAKSRRGKPSNRKGHVRPLRTRVRTRDDHPVKQSTRAAQSESAPSGEPPPPAPKDHRRVLVLGGATALITVGVLAAVILFSVTGNDDMPETPTPHELVFVGETPTATPTDPPTATPTYTPTVLTSPLPTFTFTPSPEVTITPVTTLVPAAMLPPTQIQIPSPSPVLQATDTAPAPQPAPLADSPPAENSPPPGNPSVMVPMPSAGPCVLSTLRNYQTNIRAKPTTQSDVLGQILPSRTYDVTGQSQQPDGIWYQVNGGWVAARVSRLGGGCGGVPSVAMPIQPQGAPAAAPIPAPQANPGGGAMADNFVPSTVDLRYRWIMFPDGSVWVNPNAR